MMVASASKSGSNQDDLKRHNDRIVLHTLREFGPQSKADLARHTGLSTQSVAVIVSRLMREQLLLKQAPVRGQIGQPSVPIALNPEGAHSLGVHIGRRDLVLVVIDFVGCVRHTWQTHYDYPTPSAVLAEIAQGVAQFKQTLGKDWAKLCGVGLTAPLGLAEWTDWLGSDTQAAAAREGLQAWRAVDITQQVQALFDIPVTFTKDTTAACFAEVCLGKGRSISDFLYIYLGTFVGGSVVLNSKILQGFGGNSGAIGSMPIGSNSGKNKPPQLIETASLWRLRNEASLSLQSDWLSEPSVQQWLSATAQSLSGAVLNTAAVLEIEAVCLQGQLPQAVLLQLQADLEKALARYNWAGLRKPRIVLGEVGLQTQALGAALMALFTKYGD